MAGREAASPSVGPHGTGRSSGAEEQKQELLAELISLEAESPASGEIQKRLAELFLWQAAPARAANVYAALSGRIPSDIAAYEGLGDAELEQGQYRAAHETYLRAFLREPNNASVRAHLQTLNTVTGLDPTLRQLTSAEKYRRSIRILEMTRDAVDQCVAKRPSASSDPNSGGKRATAEDGGRDDSRKSARARYQRGCRGSAVSRRKALACRDNACAAEARIRMHWT